MAPYVDGECNQGGGRGLALGPTWRIAVPDHNFRHHPRTSPRVFTGSMTPIHDYFDALFDHVRATAGAHGFAVVDAPAHGHPFGDLSATFRRGAEALRLRWDGREQWLCLEYRPMPEYGAAYEWTGLLSERYDGRGVSVADQERLRAGLDAALERIWSRRHAAPV